MDIWEEWQQDCFEQPSSAADGVNDTSDFMDNDNGFMEHNDNFDFGVDIDIEDEDADLGHDTRDQTENNTSDFLDLDMQIENPVAACSSQPIRKVGRPKGTFGNKGLRKKQKDLQREQQDAMLALQPPPGTIEFAREAKRKKAETMKLNQAASASTVADEHGTEFENADMTLTLLAPRSQLWEALQDLGTPLQQTLVEAAQFSMNRQTQKQREQSRVSQLLKLKAQAGMSDKALKLLLDKRSDEPEDGVDKGSHVTTVSRSIVEASAAAVLGGGVLWGGLLHTVYEAIRNNTFNGILCIQKMRYDETPLKIRLTEKVDTTSSSAGGTEVCPHGKVMQIEYTIYLLLEEIASGKRVLFSGRVPTLLQCVDRTTAECTVQAIKNVRSLIPDLGKAAGAFKHRMRVAATRLCPSRGNVM